MSLENHTSDEESDVNQPSGSIEHTIMLERELEDLFFDISTRFSGKIKSFQMMADDNFVHRRDRTINDIHVFFELKNGKYFHLRAYTKHMLSSGQDVENKRVFLTGYLKDSIAQTGGTHSFRQDWYDWDSDKISQEIISQNPELFQ